VLRVWLLLHSSMLAGCFVCGSCCMLPCLLGASILLASMFARGFDVNG